MSDMYRRFPGRAGPAATPHGSSLWAHRRMDGSGTWFLTKCVEPRRSTLLSGGGDVIVEALQHRAVAGTIAVAAFAVMPDHWHVLLALRSHDAALPVFMAELDRWVSEQTNPELTRHGCWWQDGYHDTFIRSSRQFRYVANYIENNPVEKGLAVGREAWRWSSACAAHWGWLTKPWPWSFPKDEDG